jgi:hypothetical protein
MSKKPTVRNKKIAVSNYAVCEVTKASNGYVVRSYSQNPGSQTYIALTKEELTDLLFEILK